VTIPKLEYSHDNELDAALVEATDRRVGDWTYLQLMRMNQKFVARMRRHHGDLEVPHGCDHPSRRTAIGQIGNS
jgi:hypothetical protein